MAARKNSLPYQIRKKGSSSIYQVRGSWKGYRLERSTGSRDYDEAFQRAAGLWAEFLSNVESGVARSNAEAGEECMMNVVASSWLIFLASMGISSETIRGYRVNIKKLASYFPYITDVTYESVQDFQLVRLGQVQRTTVMSERNVLNAIMEHAQQKNLIPTAPKLPRPSKQNKGTKAKGRRRAGIKATEEQVDGIIALMPEASERSKFPVRDFCVLLWETGLRPCLWYRASSLRHWKPGQGFLDITSDIDKARWERRVILSQTAVNALDRVYEWASGRSDSGLLFPSFRGTELKGCSFDDELKKAAQAVMGDVEGQHFNTSCFRGSRVTHWLNQGKLKPQVMYLVGHRKSTTTDLYDKTAFSETKDFFGSYDPECLKAS